MARKNVDGAEKTALKTAGSTARGRAWVAEPKADATAKAKGEETAKDGIVDDEPLWSLGLTHVASRKLEAIGIKTIGDLRKTSPEEAFATGRVSFKMMEKLRDAAKAAGIACPISDDERFAKAATATPKWIEANEKERKEREKKYEQAIKILNSLHVAHGLPPKYGDAKLDWS